ncbi:MAG: sporulation protein YqfD [Oscillospiraceae bacterium]|nr:sporulation protein YqfD [Oscillospiraceae bacterium]
MKLYKTLRGTVRVELCGADPEAALNLCARRGVILLDIAAQDACTLQSTLYEAQLEELKDIAARCMCELRVLGQSGGSRNLKLMRRRIGLLLAAALTTGLLLISSLYIWEIRVEGCERLTQGQVLRALAECGVEQGSYWPAISSDRLRSRMLLKMPELAWITVNVRGSCATVRLVEREERPAIYREEETADVVAAKDGVVRELYVLNGKALVRPGDTVLQGEPLVSGKLESITGPVRSVHAEARVIADTWYEMTAVCPIEARQKVESRGRRSRFALKIGDRRINFYINGKKTLDGYDRIVHEYRLGLEGVFALPLCLVREEIVRYETAEEPPQPERAMGVSLQRVLWETVDGAVVSAALSSSRDAERVCVTLRAQCRENIAKTIDTQGTETSP